jgi:dihydrolipoamide dehydrogenase
MDALRAVQQHRGPGRTNYIVNRLVDEARREGIYVPNSLLISEVCLAIEMGCDTADIGKTIHPHPTLGESIGMAAEVFEGHCTDLPPQKKK